MPKQFDVVVIGGGLAGASCALSVAKINLCIILFREVGVVATQME